MVSPVKSYNNKKALIICKVCSYDYLMRQLFIGKAGDAKNLERLSIKILLAGEIKNN